MHKQLLKSVIGMAADLLRTVPYAERILVDGIRELNELLAGNTENAVDVLERRLKELVDRLP